MHSSSTSLGVQGVIHFLFLSSGHGLSRVTAELSFSALEYDVEK